MNSYQERSSSQTNQSTEVKTESKMTDQIQEVLNKLKSGEMKFIC